MVVCNRAVTRRSFAVFVAAGLLLSAAGVRAKAADPAKAAAWRLGDRLSLAALLYAQGGQDANVEQFMASIKPLAETMGIAIAPFPPRAATHLDTYGETIVYLVEGGGAEIGRALAEKFGKDPGALYDAAIKSNLLLLLYEQGDDHGIGAVIKARMSEAGVPEQLWIGVVDAIDRKAPQSELKDAVVKMQDGVAAHLAAAKAE
jgi:hypothetical protein